jgi:hypothetical protein
MINEWVRSIRQSRDQDMYKCYSMKLNDFSEVIQMGTLKDELKKWKKANKKQSTKAEHKRPRRNSRRKKKRSKKKELSEREWLEVMGVFRPTYERRRGAIRQK